MLLSEVDREVNRYIALVDDLRAGHDGSDDTDTDGEISRYIALVESMRDHETGGG